MPIEADIMELKTSLDEVNSLLENLDDENFDRDLNKVLSAIKKLNSQSEGLYTNYSRDEVRKFHPELKKMTKEIKRKFDNIIEDKNKELKTVTAELNIINNRKKLSKYM